MYYKDMLEKKIIKKGGKKVKEGIYILGNWELNFKKNRAINLFTKKERWLKTIIQAQK